MSLTIGANYQPYLKNNSTPVQHKNNPEEQNAFQAWLSDGDKICTDGVNDGKISTKEAIISFGKGLARIVKTAINHPVMTGLSVAAGIGLTVATGGAALPVMAAAGAVIGGGTIAGGIYKAATAKTDGDKKSAFEQMGNGVFALATSAFGAKQALKSAANAGVEAAEGAATSNPLKNLANCFKASPDALKTSGASLKTNFLSLINKSATVETQALPAHNKQLALPEPE